MDDSAGQEVSTGTYVTIFLANVNASYVETRNPELPCVSFGLLEHENKQTVLHFKVKIHPSFGDSLRCA